MATLFQPNGFLALFAAISKGKGEPFPKSCRTSLEAIANPIDSPGAFELSKASKHLHEHSANRRGCIDRFTQAAEASAGILKCFQDAQEKRWIAEAILGSAIPRPKRAGATRITSREPDNREIRAGKCWAKVPNIRKAALGGSFT